MATRIGTASVSAIEYRFALQMGLGFLASDSLAKGHRRITKMGIKT
jgi:hypothetical protein